TAAFRLFGLHAWGLTLVMLILMGLSAGAFLLRFPDSASTGVVVLYFSALTVMLFTPLVWRVWAVQIPVGGIRSFSLVSILPIFPLLCHLMDSDSIAPVVKRRNAVLLGLQTAILVMVILVRGSALPLIGVLSLVWLTLIWRYRHSPVR